MDYSVIAIVCMAISCFIIGFSKTSIGGLGILVVPIMVYGFGAKPSLGILLPVILFTDLYNVWIYRGLCNWQAVFRLLPATAIGVISGYLLIDVVPDDWFTLLIGLVIILMLIISFYSDKFLSLIKNRYYTGVLGSLAGLTSIISNSAGTLVGMYYLQYNLDKKVFVSTRNHFFMLLNGMKFPFIISLGLITKETLIFDVFFIPMIFIGSWFGIKLLNVIDMKMLKLFVQAAALIAGVRMVYAGFEAVMAN